VFYHAFIILKNCSWENRIAQCDLYVKLYTYFCFDKLFLRYVIKFRWRLRRCGPPKLW
jgi:hypothetical protein